MDFSFLEYINGLKEQQSVYSCVVDLDSSDGKRMVLSEGFYFVLVTNGTALVEDSYRKYALEKYDLLILTPSITVAFDTADTGFSMICVYIEPAYFDTLPDGQPMYNQLVRFLGSYTLPVLRLDSAGYAYLKQTLDLFLAGCPDSYCLNREGIGRHLCSFLLLQVANILHQDSEHTSVSVRRSGEVFRNFKKLLVEHYRTHHHISFYAGRLNISTTYLSRIVKRVTGRTVYFHVSEILCAEARRLLGCTDLDIKEIADRLGFSDQSAFGKFFLKKTGVSPLKFRLRKTE